MWRQKHDETLADLYIILSLLTLLLSSVTFGNVFMSKLNISSLFFSPLLLLSCHAFLTEVQGQGMC